MNQSIDERMNSFKITSLSIIWMEWLSSLTSEHFRCDWCHLPMTLCHRHSQTPNSLVFRTAKDDRVESCGHVLLSGDDVGLSAVHLGRIHFPEYFKNFTQINTTYECKWIGLFYLRRVKTLVSSWVLCIGLCNRHGASDEPQECLDFHRSHLQHLVRCRRRVRCFWPHFDWPLTYNTNRLTFLFRFSLKKSSKYGT